MTDVVMKMCTRCQETKPQSEFFKHKSGRDGHSSRCKECTRKPPQVLTCRSCGDTWPHASPGRPKKLCAKCDAALKVCSKCDEVKPHDEFNANRRTRLGLNVVCRECNYKPRPVSCIACSVSWQLYGAGIPPKICPNCELTLKACHVCGVAKPHDAFNAARSTRSGLNDGCRDCAKAWHKDRGAKLRRINDLKTKYNLTLEDWDALVQRQGGKCACCKGDFGLLPAVDHCHDTMAIRGILCGKCNTGIGKLGDNVAGLNRAEVYLWSSRDVLSELAGGLHTLSEFSVA